MRTLVLGGARSGKSALGEQCVGDGPVVFIATGRRRVHDADWTERIEAHRRTRPEHWTTVEITAADDVVTALVGADAGAAVLIDDLGTWLTGAIDDADAWDLPRGTITPTADRLVDAVAGHTGTVILVTPEVGLGVIPPTRAGRLFQDEIGTLNARLAAVCDRVHLVVAGLATTLK